MDSLQVCNYSAAVEQFKEAEYPMLKGKHRNVYQIDPIQPVHELIHSTGSVYLDHAGTTLYSKSLVDKFANEMTSSLLGNPHSASSSSQLSTLRIEDARLRALQFFNADPTEFDLIFVANTTAGIKLVAEALRAHSEGFDFIYHQSSHTSLVGVREEARNSYCLDDDQVRSWLSGNDALVGDSTPPSTMLFAYPGQSNMDGRRYPLAWSNHVRRQISANGTSCFTLLDAAALAATSSVDLSDSETAPDFTVVSFSKIFGFPDLGGLLVRRQAEPAFSNRKYFGGGTVETVVCHKEQWHAPKAYSLHERLEDGTLPIHSIIALDIAMLTHRQLFGSMGRVASHVSFLSKRLHAGLKELRHRNGEPVCEMYSTGTAEKYSFEDLTETLHPGPIIAFNLRNQAGAWVSLSEVEKLASLKGFHIRTGGVCNPGGIAFALNLQPWEIKRNFSVGFRCGSENDIIAGKPTGVIRASLGAMSTISDVDSFIAFISEFYCEQSLPPEVSTKQDTDSEVEADLYVSDVIVYPIKSCGGFTIPKMTDWEVRPEGLAWDREWCLLHQGTGQALSQKRYTNMALIRPSLDFDAGLLRVTYAGHMSDPAQPREISVPLSSNPALFRKTASPQSPTTSTVSSHRTLPSRVCGEEILAQTYASEAITSFFSAALGVPCMLARFPPGGQEGNKSARHAKAHLQKHQKTYYTTTTNNHTNTHTNTHTGFSFTTMTTTTTTSTPPSPPDSDVEKNTERRRILLSNESPILAINMASLRALNREITSRGGNEVSPAVFRANIILDSHRGTSSCPPSSATTSLTATNIDTDAELSYAEDNWSRLRIGQQDFKMLGSCRRCHMVCVNQETGEKGEEPFVTLSKTRRFDGKVFFGTHMCHVQQQQNPKEPNGTAMAMATREAQNPTVRIGDEVAVEM